MSLAIKAVQGVRVIFIRTCKSGRAGERKQVASALMRTKYFPKKLAVYDTPETYQEFFPLCLQHETEVARQAKEDQRLIERAIAQGRILPYDDEAERRKEAQPAK